MVSMEKKKDSRSFGCLSGRKVQKRKNENQGRIRMLNGVDVCPGSAVLSQRTCQALPWNCIVFVRLGYRAGNYSGMPRICTGLHSDAGNA